MQKHKLKALYLFVSLIFISAAFSFNASAADKTVKSGDFVFSVGKSSATLVEYNGKASSVAIPEKINSVAVTAIADYAFWQNKTLTTISFPSTITKIGVAAFDECTALKTVYLPKNLTTLGDSAFWYCTGLNQVVMYDKVTSIGTNAFKGCSNVTVYVCKGSKAEALIKNSGVKFGYTYLTSVKADSALTLEIGKTASIKVTVAPSSALNKAVSYSSSNKSVAAVSSKGVVTAKGCGTAVITVKAKDSSGKSAKVNITVIPQKVTGLKQSKKTVSSHTLSWKASEGAQSYRIYKYDETSKKWTTIANTSKTSYNISGLAVGTKTKYRLKAYCTVDKTNIFSEASESVTASTTIPSNVSGLTVVSQGTNSISLKWNAASNITGYKIYEYNSSKKTYTFKSTVKATSCTIKGLASATAHSYAVKAYLTVSGKTVESEKYSSVVSAATKPSTVSGLKIDSNSISQSEMKLTWTAVSNITGYQIAFKKSSDSTWKTIKVSGAKASLYTFSSLESKTSYNFKIRAYASLLGSTYYGSYSAVVTGTTNPSIGSVDSVYEIASTASTVTIEWNEVSSADGYNIYLFDSNTDTYNQVASCDETQYTLKNLAPNQEFSIFVKAYTQSDNGTIFESGSYSSAALCTTLPQTVTTLTAKDSGKAGTAYVSWNEISGADGYIISYGKTGSANLSFVETNETSAEISGLERHVNYSFRVCAFSYHYNSRYYADYSSSAVTSIVLMPLDEKDAFDDFISSLNSAADKSFTVFENTSVQSKSINVNDENSANVLSAVINSTVNTGSRSTEFKDGKDSISGKTASEFFDCPALSLLSGSYPSKLSFAKNGTGFSVSFECTGEEAKQLGNFFASKISAEEFEDASGLILLSQSHNITVTNAKVVDNAVNSMKITDNAQYQVLDGETIYTVNLTSVSLYAFSFQD